MTPEGAVVHVYLIPQGRECPKCHSQLAESKGRKERRLKHALFLALPTLFILHLRRFRCKRCGATFSEPNPFAAKHAKVTLGTAIRILTLLADFSATYSGVAKIAGCSDTTVISSFDRWYNPARLKLPSVLCIDECYAEGQFKKPYCLMLLDWSRKNLCDVLEGREISTMRAYFHGIPKSERDAVKCVSVDMYAPYLEIAKAYLKNAVVCVDSFHVMENLCRALDRVRCRVMNGFPTDSDEYHYLKKYHWALFKDNLNPRAKRRKDAKTKRYLNPWEAVQLIRGISPDLAAAHSYYLSYKFFNSKPRTAEAAIERLDELRTDASVIEIPEMAAFMQTLTNWRQYIVNSFTFAIDGRRISNGPVEGFNSQYKKLMRVSNGLKNFQRFRARLILCSRKEIALLPPKNGVKRKAVGRKRGHYKKKKKEASTEGAPINKIG